MKNVLAVIGWFLFNILVVGAFFIVVGLCLSLCDAKASDNLEWECKAAPPRTSKYKEVIVILAYNEDKSEAERQSIWLCNKFFKTDKCKIDYCKQVKAR